MTKLAVLLQFRFGLLVSTFYIHRRLECRDAAVPCSCLPVLFEEFLEMPISERKKEIRRRRKRREKYAHFKANLEKMDAAAKEKLIEKLRNMTPDADNLAKRWGLQ